MFYGYYSKDKENIEYSGKSDYLKLTISDNSLIDLEDPNIAVIKPTISPVNEISAEKVKIEKPMPVVVKPKIEKEPEKRTVIVEAPIPASLQSVVRSNVEFTMPNKDN